MHATMRTARVAAAALAMVLAAGVLAAQAADHRDTPILKNTGVLGLITDARTGEHLAGAVVQATPAIGNPDIAESNPGGRYLLRGLAPGRYEVTARAEGYRPSEPVTVEVGGPPVHVDFALIPPGI